MSISTSTKGMIFLSHQHPIVRDTLLEKLAEDAKEEPCDVTCSDFDDVKYKILVQSEDKSTIEFHVAMPCLSAIKPLGALGVLDGPMYGGYLSSSKSADYDVVLKIKTKGNKDSAETLAKNLSEIKHNLLGAPFEKCFAPLQKGSASGIKPMVIPFRQGESIVLVPGKDRVLVFYAVHFQEETDRAIAKVFLQEFSESQRKIPQAPSVSFFYDPPADLVKVKDFKAGKKDTLVGYVQFQLFKSHVEGAKMNKIISLFTMFRGYLMYHIKASKSHLHSRMRARCTKLLKVLKRADPKEEEAAGRKNFRTYNN